MVNPYDIDETASVNAALHALNERQARHHNLLKIIRTQDAHWWRGEFPRWVQHHTSSRHQHRGRRATASANN
jgi:trehalose-6-phosphate synthase